MNAIDPLLAEALGAIAVTGVLVGHRVIQPGDESVLFETEAKTVVSPAPEKRRASGAARIVGRALLKQLGLPESPFPKRVSGVPLWPDGVTGSFAHDQTIAVAALGLRKNVGAIGIDIEPATMLPDDMFELVTTPQERSQIPSDPYRGRLLFAVKEATYKAVHPLDGKFLDYHDIQINLDAKKAVTKTGRVVDVRFCLSTHIVAVAWLDRV